MEKMDKPQHCTGCALYEEEQVSVAGAEEPDIVFVGSYPKPYDLRKGPFFSKGNSIIRSMCRDMDKTIKRDKQPKKAFTFAVRCCPQNNEYKVYSETYNQCRALLRTYLESRRPKVILSFGTEAMRCLGLKGTVTNLRGGIYQYHYTSGESAVIIPCYDTYQLVKQPGLIPVMENDLRKAYSFILDDLSVEDFVLHMPTDVEGILGHLEQLKQDADESYARNGKPLAVAIDTETTGLTPYVEDLRMIAISLSWAPDKGLAFPYEHRECQFSAEDLQRIKLATEEALNRESVSLFMFNAKFDHQWLVLKYNFNLPFAKYDAMLAEHLLEEDKKGNYSLKVLTKDYFPIFGNYEEELKKLLEAVTTERREAYNAAVDEKKKEQEKIMLEYWMGLDQDHRRALCAKWLNKGYKLGNYQDLIEVKWRKYKGEMVVLKKYEASVSKMLKRISPEDLEIELPELDVAPPEPATFEDIDLEVLLKYAAIDAIMTRKISAKQLSLFAREDQHVKKIEKEIRARLPIAPLKTALYEHSMPLCNVLAEMEYGGVRLDRDRTRQYIDTLNSTIEELEDKLYSDIGYRFNTSSSAGDLRRILFQEKGYPVKRVSDQTGEASTDAETLKELYDEYDDEFLKTLLSHRKIEKCVNTYLKSWLEKSDYDGRIHCQFNQMGTATHRLSSSKPNLGHCLEVVKPREFRGHLNR